MNMVFVLFVFMGAGVHTAGTFPTLAACEKVGEIYAKHYCGQVNVPKPKGEK